MTYPRVKFTVTRDADTAEWKVKVEGVGIEESYPMLAAEITVDGRAFTVPSPTDSDTDQLLKRLWDRGARDGDVMKLGRWLFRCLVEPVWNRLRAALADVPAKGVELALCWRSDDVDLHRLSWESMHDGNEFLAGDEDLTIAITRVVSDVTKHEIAPIERVPRVLFAVGDMQEEGTIRAGAMFMGLLRSFEAKAVCTTRAIEHVTIETLTNQCDEFLPDLVHLVAHGEPDGGVRLGGARVEAEELARALTNKHRPLAVVISACGSGAAADGGRSLAAQLVAAGIPIVSAVIGDVSEQACRLYTKRLVNGISHGGALVSAAADGRRAALRHGNSGVQLDWAMPALFISQLVKPSFRPFDSSRTRWLVAAAETLLLRRPPLYIGRKPILNLVDRIFSPEPADQLDVIGVVTPNSIAGLGGTRLLQEIGYRLLMCGHLPIVLGPYAPTGQPTTIRDVATRIAKNMNIFGDTLGLPSPRFTLGEEFLGSGNAETSERTLFAARQRFSENDKELEWEMARLGLVADAVSLRADAVKTHPDLFGAHSRLVVLADNLHTWTPIDDLLEWLSGPGSQGMGKGGERIPVVFTAETGDARAAPLKLLVEKHWRPRFASPQLDRLTDHEMLIGYQWVLLHPWRDNGNPADPCRSVYTAPSNISDEVLIKEFREKFGDLPADINKPSFYKEAQNMVGKKVLVEDNDEAAWDAYQRTYRG